MFVDLLQAKAHSGTVVDIDDGHKRSGKSPSIVFYIVFIALHTGFHEVC